MSATTKIQARGQVTLPAKVGASVGFNPGDSVTTRVLGPGRIEMSSLPRKSIEELMAIYPNLTMSNWHEIREEGESAAAGEYGRELGRQNT